MHSLLKMTEARALEHKFKIGQSVNLAHGPFGRASAAAFYKIMQLLPPEGDDYQYRVKTAGHERVVKENQLSPVA